MSSRRSTRSSHTPRPSRSPTTPRTTPRCSDTPTSSTALTSSITTAICWKRARAFLLYVDGQLAGDADLRGIAGGAAEFAFLIAAKSAQGKGLGTRFARALTAFGFRDLGLHHVYASVVPVNVASARVFSKLGFVVDESEAARRYADEPEDITFSIDRATFEAANAALLADLRIERIP